MVRILFFNRVRMVKNSVNAYSRKYLCGLGLGFGAESNFSFMN